MRELLFSRAAIILDDYFHFWRKWVWFLASILVHGKLNFWIIDVVQFDCTDEIETCLISFFCKIVWSRNLVSFKKLSNCLAKFLNYHNNEKLVERLLCARNFDQIIFFFFFLTLTDTRTMVIRKFCCHFYAFWEVFSFSNTFPPPPLNNFHFRIFWVFFGPSTINQKLNFWWEI